MCSRCPDDAPPLARQSFGHAVPEAGVLHALRRIVPAPLGFGVLEFRGVGSFRPLATDDERLRVGLANGLLPLPTSRAHDAGVDVVEDAVRRDGNFQSEQAATQVVKVLPYPLEDALQQGCVFRRGLAEDRGVLIACIFGKGLGNGFLYGSRCRLAIFIVEWPPAFDIVAFQPSVVSGCLFKRGPFRFRNMTRCLQRMYRFMAKNFCWIADYRGYYNVLWGSQADSFSSSPYPPYRFQNPRNQFYQYVRRKKACRFRLHGTFNGV